MEKVNGHKVQGLYHTNIAYTCYECVNCKEIQTTPRGFENISCN